MPGPKEKKQTDISAAVQNPEIKDIPEQPVGETGGPKGPEPTRFGDWEIGGRCSDF